MATSFFLMLVSWFVVVLWSELFVIVQRLLLLSAFLVKISLQLAFFSRLISKLLFVSVKWII